MAMTPEEFEAYKDRFTQSIEFANKLPTSQIGAGLSAGKANWAAGMGALGGALGLDTEDFVRRKLEDAAFYQQHAPGATSFFGEGGVADGGSIADWLAYNFGQSAPYILEMIGGAGVGGLALKSARGAAAARAAVEMAGQQSVKEAAARATLGGKLTERAALEQGLGDVAARYAMGAGGAAASYPSAVADILLNQREAGGEYELGPALAGGIPYAALNLLGGEAAVGRAMTGGLARRAGVEATEAATNRTLLGGVSDFAGNTLRGENLPGAVLRGAGRAGLMEGLGETGQEVINQTFGRMLVNPEEGLFTGDAPMRYAESFMAGLGMGAIPGGGAAIFAKPTSATPDAIAERASQMDRSLQQILQGNETWRESLDRSRQEEADYLAERQAQAEEKAKADEELLKQALATQQEQLRTQREAIQQAFEGMQSRREEKERAEKTTKEDLAYWRDNPLFGEAPAPVPLPAVAAIQDTPFDSWLGDIATTAVPVLHGPPTPQENLSTAMKQLGVAMDTAPLIGPGLGTLSLTDAFNTAHSALKAAGKVPQDMGVPRDLALEAQDEALAQRALNPKPAERPLETAMQDALLGVLKPLQEDAAWNQYVAEQKAKQQAEVDAAYEQRGDTTPKVGKELLGTQPDMFGFEGWSPAEVAASKLRKAPAEPAPDLANVNDYLTEGLQISAEWEAAKAAGDEAKMVDLRKRAESVFERMAIGFPKAPGTAEMFQWREGESKPRITPAATAATGNAFRPKGATRGTTTAQAQQTEPTAPQEAAAQPAAAPITPTEETANGLQKGQKATQEVDKLQALINKINSRKKYVTPAAKRKLVQEQETQDATGPTEVAEEYESKPAETAAPAETQPAETAAPEGKPAQATAPEVTPAADELVAPEFLPSELETLTNIEVVVKKKKRGEKNPVFDTAAEALEFIDKKIAAYTALIDDLRKC